MRLFTAIPIPPVTQKLLERFSGGIRDVRWIDAFQYHLTLTFHESVIPEEFPAMIEILSSVSCPHFELKLNGTGSFPSKKGAILWAAVSQSEPLLELQEKISRTLTGEGFPGDKRKFHPHITLGRAKQINSHELNSFLEQGLFLTGESFEVNHFSLYSSQLNENGAIHTEEERFGDLS